LAIVAPALLGAVVFLTTAPSLPQVAALEQQATVTGAATQPQATPQAGLPATATATVTPTATPQSALPAGIVAIAGRAGASAQPLDDAATVLTIPVGGKLHLVGRAADSAWLVAEIDGVEAWVSRAAVVVFNVDRLPVVTATPPAAPLAGATPIVTPTAVKTPLPVTVAAPPATADDADAAVAVATPDAAASISTTVTAQLNVSQARGLNIRSGPGADYTRVGAIAAGDTLVVTGRNAAGDWLAVELPDASVSGWAAASYLRVTGDLETLPEVAAATAAPASTAPAATSGDDDLPTPATSVTAAPVQSAVSAGLEGALVFQTGQGGAIYAYDLATGALWPLTTGFDPAISPDGATVAFARVGNDAGLYLIDIDGSNERQIYSGPRVVASPKWSMDGTQILFNYATSETQCRDLGGGRCVTDDKFATGRYSDLDINDYVSITIYTYDIGVVAADGSSFRSLSALNTGRAPDWAPDGIVYQSSDGIQVMSTQGGDSHVILFDPLTQVDQDPDWAGGRIVFQRPGASHWEIWTADANGANITALTQPQTVLVDHLPSNVSPAYSPDGSQIAFLSNRTDDGEAGAWRIWVMNADGSNQRALPIDVAINYTFGAEQMVSWGN